MLRQHPRIAVAVRATRNGEPAGSGIVIMTAGAASLWSGSVLPAHRGHGLQRAIIAERVRIAIARGARACFSLAEPGGRSARNLRAVGFRDLGPLRVFTR
jgi:ribosomal protein S18 acetylase RimI-like enzyme